MSVLVYMIPIALTLGLAGLCGFLWALRNGQFDDLDGAARRILFDDAAGTNQHVPHELCASQGTRPGYENAEKRSGCYD